MKKAIFLCIIIAVSSLMQLYGQKTNNELKGDKYYSIYSFGKAIKNYSKNESLSIDGQRKLAKSYQNIANYIKAEEEYAKLITYQELLAEDFYNYALVLKMNKKYEEANKWMDKFKKAKPNDLRAKNYIAKKSEFHTLLKDEGRYEIKNLDINTEQQDFGAAYYKDKIVFASSREGTKAIRRNYNWNQKAFLNLFIANVSSGQLCEPERLKELNNKLHEGLASFSNDGTFMAFTRNNYDGKSKDGIVKLQLFFSTMIDGKWSKIEAFELNDAEYSVGHPCLTKDGRTMYFASDMPGGCGGVDIYCIEKDASGNWGTAKNLKTINTEGNEMFPFYEENNQVLFFASDGHLGLGGLDLFFTEKKGENFGKIINMGFPANSNYDDFALIVDEDLKNGYLSSNREGGKGDDDIYAFEILKPFKSGKTITGVAKDKLGNKLEGAIVKLYDESGNEVAEVLTGKDGAYSFAVEEDKKYKLNGAKEKYFPQEVMANTSIEEDIIANITLEKDPGISLYCLVMDKNSIIPIEGVKIKIINNQTGETESIITPISGDFRIPLVGVKLNDKVSYYLVLEKEGYLTKTVTYERTLDKEGGYNVHEEEDMSLVKLEKGQDLAKLIDIKPIYFDLSKWNIRSDAAIELDKIVKVMNEQPTMEIELGSHTDCRGSDASNMSLSDKRAKASAEYIKSRITNPERITGKGYGEVKPIIATAKTNEKFPFIPEGQELTESFINQFKSTSRKKFDDAHQLNRRTEFIIVKP